MIKNIRLNNGVEIPAIGFGTYKSTESDGYKVVLDALRCGYRHLDTAALYENEEEVGRAIRESGIPRHEIFLTSKLRRNDLGYQEAKDGLEASLKLLGTDYLDLYLLHWPRADFGHPKFDGWKEQDLDSWRALEEMVAEGKIRAIGVSNFLPHHMDNLMTEAKIVPAVNQLELHPGYLQKEACEDSRRRGIELEAWSPMGRARLADNELLKGLAAKYDTSVAHLCLVFDYQEGFIVLPKSTKVERMKENMVLDDIVIAPEDMELIRNMPQTGWGGEHPDLGKVETV